MIAEIDALGFAAKQIDEEAARADPAGTGDPAGKSARVEELLEQARRENRPLVLEFSGKFCDACTRLEKETLADPGVREVLARVIFERIMVEEDRTAARQFGVHGIPQLLFLAPDGRVVARDKGVISVETMLAHLARLEEEG